MAAQVKDVSDVLELNESTSCCICTEIYRCPKLLPCVHTFCLNCIQDIGLKTRKGPGDEMPCPICRQQFKIPSVGFAGLQNNYYVEGLIRVAHMLDTSVGKLGACDACLEDNQEIGELVKRAEMYCCDCEQKLCEECFRHHRKLKVTKNHRLISINEQRPADEDLIQDLVPVVCDLHIHEDLKIYCRTCKTCVCAVCFIESHKGHKGAHVNKAVDEFRNEIASNIEKVKTCISEANMKKSEITKSRQEFVGKLENLESEIINRRDALKQVVDKQAKELLDELYSIRNSRMKEILIETDNIDAQLARLESYTTYCKKIMNKGSAGDICRSVGDLSARVSELQEENLFLIELQPRRLFLRFIKTDLEAEGLRNVIGQLKHDVCRTSLEGVKTGQDVPIKLQHTFSSPSLTKEQRNKILHNIKLFRFPHLSITTCIFEDDYVEFYFVLEDISSIEKSILINEIAAFLDIDASFAERIRVTQLKSRPSGVRTHSAPGNFIKNTPAQRTTTSTLGAFVSIEGIGDHLLSCGHDKSVGDILSNVNDERIGTIQAAAFCTRGGQTYDTAVAKVDNITYTKSVACEGRQLHLSATPVDPVKGTVVQRFPPRPMASRATIRHTDYNSFAHDIDLCGCIAVITDSREDFHGPGESGLLVTSLPSAEFPETVDPIGMLFFLEFVEKTDDGRGYHLSLAIPVTKNLEKLREYEYCGSRQITFLRDT